jgi:hypothetical protein
MGVLAAPLAIAYWIERQAPELVTREVLRLLLIGAEKLDAVDGGRWYALIPLLVGGSFRVEVTLVGAQLDATFRSPLAEHAPACTVQRHQRSLAEYVRSRQCNHELAFAFHPGFQKYHGWLLDGSLAAVIGSGAPCVASAYEADESEIDRMVVRCHGFSNAATVLRNPYALALNVPGSQAHWAHTLWRFGAKTPAPGAAVDRAGLAQLDELARMVMHSIALDIKPLGPYGASLAFRASDGSTRSLVYIFDDYFLDPGTARLMRFRAGTFDDEGMLEPGFVDAYPRDGSELERAIWAASVKSRQLMRRYALLPDDAQRALLARSMHAELEHRVDLIFRA